MQILLQKDKTDLWNDGMYHAKFFFLLLLSQTDFSLILETESLHF